ncbi:MAG: hypothetical protein M1815_005680 [Lichina confinis]|nr:MAG: hypothetical protein M1815_005680 [Lichina confinis]
MVDLGDQLANLSASRRPRGLAVLIATSVLSTVAVALRVWSKRLLRRTLQSDDWGILFSLVMFWGGAIVGLIAHEHGFGKHALAIGLRNVKINVKTPRASQIILAFEVLLTICIFSIKFALLLFYRHTFPIRKFQLAVYGAMVLNVTMAVAISLGYLLQCRPISYMWDRSIKGSCFDIRLYLRITIILNLFTDFTVLLMPLPLVWRLQMTVGRKISISVMFLLGTMACAASCARFVAVGEILESDPAWTSINPAIWTYTEACLGIIASCLPMLRPLYNRLARSCAGSAAAKGSRSGVSGSSDNPPSGFSRGKWSRRKPYGSTVGSTTVGSTTVGTTTVGAMSLEHLHESRDAILEERGVDSVREQGIPERGIQLDVIDGQCNKTKQ